MIAIGCDHGGYDLKLFLEKHLDEKGIAYKDLGCDSTDSVDYPEYGRAVAKAVADGSCEKGIVICSTGIGISIAANKVPGIRAALCTNTMMARLTREHNDANVLALGGYIVGPQLAAEIMDTFLSTEFSGGERHVRRVGKIENV